MILAISMRLPSVANLREHWRTRHRRSKAQRLAVALSMRTHKDLKRLRALVQLAIEARQEIPVKLIRVAPRFLDDDNLASAFKSVRDQVAKELGVGDAPKSPLKFTVAQIRPQTPNATPGIMVIVGSLS